MITSSHIIYGWVAAKVTEREPNQRRTLAFILGSVLPDLPIYTFFFVHTFFLGTSQQLMWNELYFDSSWSIFFTLSHSLLLWPGLLVLGALLKQQLVQYVAVAGTLHVCLDFFVHNDDAYAHFWPLSEWRFISPISYWDPQHYGQFVSTIDAIVIVSLLGWLVTHYKTRWARYGIAGVIVLYISSVIAPYFIF